MLDGKVAIVTGAARGLGKVDRGEELRRDWITARVRRMFTPVIPLLLAWVLLRPLGHKPLQEEAQLVFSRHPLQGVSLLCRFT